MLHIALRVAFRFLFPVVEIFPISKLFELEEGKKGDL